MPILGDDTHSNVVRTTNNSVFLIKNVRVERKNDYICKSISITKNIQLL